MSMGGYIGYIRSAVEGELVPNTPHVYQKTSHGTGAETP
jgi:hypothetical protein